MSRQHKRLAPAGTWKTPPSGFDFSSLVSGSGFTDGTGDDTGAALADAQLLASVAVAAAAPTGVDAVTPTGAAVMAAASAAAAAGAAAAAPSASVVVSVPAAAATGHGGAARGSHVSNSPNSLWGMTRLSLNDGTGTGSGDHSVSVTPTMAAADGSTFALPPGRSMEGVVPTGGQKRGRSASMSSAAVGLTPSSLLGFPESSSRSSTFLGLGGSALEGPFALPTPPDLAAALGGVGAGVNTPASMGSFGSFDMLMADGSATTPSTQLPLGGLSPAMAMPSPPVQGPFGAAGVSTSPQLQSAQAHLAAAAVAMHGAPRSTSGPAAMYHPAGRLASSGGIAAGAVGAGGAAGMGMGLPRRPSNTSMSSASSSVSGGLGRSKRSFSQSCPDLQGLSDTSGGAHVAKQQRFSESGSSSRRSPLLGRGLAASSAPRSMPDLQRALTQAQRSTARARAASRMPRSRSWLAQLHRAAVVTSPSGLPPRHASSPSASPPGPKPWGDVSMIRDVPSPATPPFAPPTPLAPSLPLPANASAATAAAAAKAAALVTPAAAAAAAAAAVAPGVPRGAMDEATKKRIKLERSRASARVRRERKRLRAESLRAQVKCLEDAIAAVRAHRWCAHDCRPMFAHLHKTDTLLGREQSPISPPVVQSRASNLVQRHAGVVRNIRRDLRACELLMQVAMYARSVASGSSRQATPLIAELLGVLQLTTEQATKLAGMSTQLARLKREVSKTEKVLAGLVARSRMQCSGSESDRARRWMKFDVLGTCVRPFKDVWTPALRKRFLEWSTLHAAAIRALPLLSRPSPVAGTAAFPANR